MTCLARAESSTVYPRQRVGPASLGTTPGFGLPGRSSRRGTDVEGVPGFARSYAVAGFFLSLRRERSLVSRAGLEPATTGLKVHGLLPLSH